MRRDGGFWACASETSFCHLNRPIATRRPGFLTKYHNVTAFKANGWLSVGMRRSGKRGSMDGPSLVNCHGAARGSSIHNG